LEANKILKIKEYMKQIKKENIATKICCNCNKIFTWRKKWEKNWEAVKYCSDKCRKKR
jgi:hypothetical protein